GTAQRSFRGECPQARHGPPTVSAHRLRHGGCFIALNDVFGPIFDVSLAEAAEPDAAAQRASGLAGQFILDDQVHFVRDDYKVEDILGLAKYAGQHWNPALLKDQLGISLDRYKFENFLKEVYLDSDTKVTLLSGAP